MVVELFGNVGLLDKLILVSDSFQVAGLQAHIYWLLKQHKVTHPHHASTLVPATYFLSQPLSAHAQAATLVSSSHASLSVTITAFSSCSTDLCTPVKREPVCRTCYRHADRYDRRKTLSGDAIGIPQACHVPRGSAENSLASTRLHEMSEKSVNDICHMRCHFTSESCKARSCDPVSRSRLGHCADRFRTAL